MADLPQRLDEVAKGMAQAVDRLAQLARPAEKPDAAVLAEVRQAADLLRQHTRRQANIANRLLRSSRAEREAIREAVFRRLDTVARRRGPVIVGPWTGEVGFELLYWAPFVRWAVRKFRIDPARVTIVSRGGTASWYDIEGARYVDAFTIVSPDEFRAGTSGETKKQRRLSAFDRRLLRAARSRVEGAGASLLHPALMYSLYMPYWKRQEPVTWVTEAADFARVNTAPAHALEGRLPDAYVAVRFYFSDCFPDTVPNRAAATGLVRSLSGEIPVVLIGAGLRVDDHQDFSLAGANVVTIEDLMRPETNLAIQTAAIAGSRAFIGTYGGYSYLAPLCGVPTLAVYSDYNYFSHHLEFARTVFDDVEAAPFSSVDVATLPLLRHLSAGAPPIRVQS